MRAGATSEMMSGITLDTVKILQDEPGVARQNGGPVITSEVVVVAPFPLRATGTDANVQVRKQAGMLLVHIVDKSGKHLHIDKTKPAAEENVDVKVPLEVADALFSGAADELNVAAALDVLSKHDHLELVTVHDSENDVRIWLDTKTTQD
jgi:hypothetical protein